MLPTGENTESTSTPAPPTRLSPPGDSGAQGAASTHAAPPGMGGKAVNRGVRTRWEDYLSPGAAAPLKPTRTLSGVLDLEKGAGTGSGAESARSPAPPAHRCPVPAATHGGPFAIPVIHPEQARATYTWQVKLAGIAFFSVVWITLTLIPASRPQPIAMVSGAAKIPAGSYARYGPEAYHDLPIAWMARLNGTLLVAAGPGWQAQDANAKVAALQRLKALGETPEEILILGKDSELLAEVYENRYRLYR